MNYPTLSMKPNNKFRSKQWLINKINEQEKFIQNCEANGSSYTGINGKLIRQADENALNRWKQLLNEKD